MARPNELAAWLRLTLTPGLGPAAVRGLLEHFGLPERVLSATSTQLARRVPAHVVDELHSDPVGKAVERALVWLAEPGNLLLTLADTGYPRLLLETGDAPPVLYCRGRVELLGRPALAVVGSRNATAQGTRNARDLARALSDAGLVIVSGLAQGIDAAAHRGGLEGAGSTIAVLGTGADVAYPFSNAPLQAEIAERGLLLSEFPLGTRPLGSNFPRRNRLISGLAQGCLVVEAALASGSLTTARAASEQGREVFAVPGSIHSPLAKGCHALIKSGAKLVETAEDVLIELRGFQHPHLTTARSPAAGPAARPASDPVLEHMGFDPVGIDALCAQTGLPAERIAAELLRLELAGHVAKLPGGQYQRTP